jgi:DNA modification methylase
MKYKTIIGDCVKEMKRLPENSIDSIVCDPPYGLKFMGKEFDDLGEGAQQREWHRLWAIEALRVLKPGGYLLAFGGTRTYHHLATAVEEAGFEIRDQIQWLYGSGFPKSHNVGKAIDKAAGKEREVIGQETLTNDIRGNASNCRGISGPKKNKKPLVRNITAPATDEAARWEGWGTALKPANEPIVVARKPFKGTVAENVQEHGTGAINIEEARIGGKEGRWPANVILDEEAGALLDEQSPQNKKGKRATPYTRKRNNGLGLGNSNLRHGQSNAPDYYGDQGGASRFFYCPKAAKKERNAGLDGFEEKQQDTGRKKGNPGGDNPRNRGVHKRANHHPTVKPVALMAYLCRLVTPPGGTVLDPFLGSGSTGLACIEEGFSFIGIEKDPEYMKIARARIKHWKKQS